MSDSEGTIRAHQRGSYPWQWVQIAIASLIIIAILSPKFKYFFKFIIYSIGVAISCTYCIFKALPTPGEVTNALYASNCLRRFVTPSMGLKFDVIGTEILEKEGAAVVVCNHQSALDLLVICELWERMHRCAVVVKKSLRYYFVLGWAAWISGTVFIDRRDATESKKQIANTAQLIKKANAKLWIFPEGTRSKKSQLLPFKKGAFHIALQNQLPIIPVVVAPYQFIDDRRKIFNSGTVKVKVLPQILPEDFGDVSTLTEKVHGIMNEEFLKLSS